MDARRTSPSSAIGKARLSRLSSFGLPTSLPNSIRDRVEMMSVERMQLLTRLSRSLARSEDGAVLIYASIALAVFMGFAALVIDGGRLFTLDTEMQSAADS